MTLHKNLTGTDLHEPKGVASAASGKVYVSNGLGSGTWQYPILTATTNFSGLPNFANDAAAATGGVVLGQLYRNGSVVMVRVV